MSAITVLSGKLAKEVSKNKGLKEKNKCLSQKNKRLNQRVQELLVSRDKWKSKKKSKQVNEATLRHQNRDSMKVERHQYPLWLISLSVFLRVNANISYRGIQKVLLTLEIYFELLGPSVPCANTIQNWTAKMGYYNLHLDRSNEGFRKVGLIIDESIQIGDQKLLLILLTPCEKEKQTALGFSDVSIAHLSFSTSWTSEKISALIKEKVMGPNIEIKYVLSDEDGKLKKMSKQLGLPHLPDISHGIATCLRKVYEKGATYEAFVKLVASYQSKGVNQTLSYLLPPKQRGKARFMNQHNLVNWANQVLGQYDCLDDKAQLFFKDLALHQQIIQSLDACLQIAQKLAFVLKNEGFHSQTQSKLKDMLQKTEIVDNKHEDFMRTLSKYVENYQENIYAIIPSEQQAFTGFNVCSDVIESLFGKYKSIISENAWVGASSMCLELPLYTFEEHAIQDKIKCSLEGVLMSDIRDWKMAYESDNQHIKRNAFFKNRKKKYQL